MDDFVQIDGRTRGAAVAGGVSVAIHDDRRSHVHSLAIVISAEVMGELAWKPGDRIAVLEGRGTSLGVLLLRPADANSPGCYTLARQGPRGDVTLKISRRKFTHNVIPDRSHVAQAVKHMAFNTDLKITLPKWEG